MKTPSWVLVLNPFPHATRDHLNALQSELVEEIGRPPAAVTMFDSAKQCWPAITAAMSLRPPSMRLMKSKWTPPSYKLSSKLPLLFHKPNGGAYTYQILAGGYDRLYGIHFFGDHFSREYTGHLYHVSQVYKVPYFHQLPPGEEVAIIRDGHIYCLGTVQTDDSLAP